jgi:hypothetical protein
MRFKGGVLIPIIHWVSSKSALSAEVPLSIIQKIFPPFTLQLKQWKRFFPPFLQTKPHIYIWLKIISNIDPNKISKRKYRNYIKIFLLI